MRFVWKQENNKTLETLNKKNEVCEHVRRLKVQQVRETKTLGVAEKWLSDSDVSEAASFRGDGRRPSSSDG